MCTVKVDGLTRLLLRSSRINRPACSSALLITLCLLLQSLSVLLVSLYQLDFFVRLVVGLRRHKFLLILKINLLLHYALSVRWLNSTHSELDEVGVGLIERVWICVLGWIRHDLRCSVWIDIRQLQLRLILCWYGAACGSMIVSSGCRCRLQNVVMIIVWHVEWHYSSIMSWRNILVKTYLSLMATHQVVLIPYGGAVSSSIIIWITSLRSNISYLAVSCKFVRYSCYFRWLRNYTWWLGIHSLLEHWSSIWLLSFLALSRRDHVVGVSRLSNVLQLSIPSLMSWQARI